MKIIYNNIIPFKGFCAINLFGILFVRKGCTVTKTVLNHETIHTKQMVELAYIFFYLIYFIEWIIKLFVYRDAMLAYENISFEREAYDNQHSSIYVHKPYTSFKRFIK